MTADEREAQAAGDEAMIADLRAWRERVRVVDDHRFSARLTLGEIDAVLRAIDERDALKREAVTMPDERVPGVDGLYITSETLRDAEPAAVLAVVEGAIERQRPASLGEPCTHEAWEDRGNGSRKCADCGLWLADERVSRAAGEPPAAPPAAPHSWMSCTLPTYKEHVDICKLPTRPVKRAACGRTYEHPEHPHGFESTCDGIPEAPEPKVALCVTCGKPIRGYLDLGLAGAWEHVEIRAGYPEHDPKPIA